MTAPALLVKKRLGFLSAGDPHAKAIIDKMGIGEVALFSIRRIRNPKLHRKFFALIQFAFDNWRPDRTYEYGSPRGAVEKDIETFRRDLIIAAGFHKIVLGMDGKAYLEARSIAWDQMGEEEFTPLYEAVVRVLAQGFIPGMTPAEAERFVNELEGF